MRDDDRSTVKRGDMELHQRLLEEDPLASRDVALLYFDGLWGWYRHT